MIKHYCYDQKLDIFFTYANFISLVRFYGYVKPDATDACNSIFSFSISGVGLKYGYQLGILLFHSRK